ncbi:complement regulator-acquiring protein [Borreliella bavariensis]|uniref:complement regulator-acquiring protein n=1 Tax=Borreliella bavariensis TaxID=664662 RepID=UPI001C006EE4|nr:complement regulator-acquiring protein [Borreliella bavariensis]
MKKTKLNIIKLNILTTILTLICISCTVNKIDPESKSKTNPKENTKDFENKSQDLEPSNTKNKDLKPLKKNSKETIISKLEKMIKDLEDQKEKEDTEIAKITNTQIDFLETFKSEPHDTISEDIEMKIKRIIYSSLNYEIEKIKTLKEILNKLYQNHKYRTTARNFILNISINIQFQLEYDLELMKEEIKDASEILNQERYEILLKRVEPSLNLKQKFEKILNETIKAYNQDLNNMKTDVKALAKHMDENYKEFDPLNPGY